MNETSKLAHTLQRTLKNKRGGAESPGKSHQKKKSVKYTRLPEENH